MSLLTKTDLVFSKVYGDYLKLARYLGIGFITTIVDWAIFYLLIGYTGIFYMFALATSYLTSTVFSFFLNKHFTFRNTYNKVHIQLASFFVVAIFGLGINEALMYGISNFLFSGSSERALMASRIIATLVVFIWNFILNKRITFNIFR